MNSEIILLMLSGGSIAIGVYLWRRGDQLLLHGKKAKAIVFKNNFKGATKTMSMYFPVVRFLTEDKQWITQELSIGYNPPLEEGTELEVIYDPDDPTVVEISSGTHLVIIPRAFVAVGLFGIIFLLLEIFEVVDIIENT